MLYKRKVIIKRLLQLFIKCIEENESQRGSLYKEEHSSCWRHGMPFEQAGWWGMLNRWDGPWWWGVRIWQWPCMAWPVVEEVVGKAGRQQLTFSLTAGSDEGSQWGPRADRASDREKWAAIPDPGDLGWLPAKLSLFMSVYCLQHLVILQPTDEIKRKPIIPQAGHSLLISCLFLWNHAAL